MLKGAYETRCVYPVTGVHSRTGGVPQVRSRDTGHSFRTPLHASPSRESISREGECKSEPTRAETKGQAFRFPRLWRLAFRGLHRLPGEFIVGQSLAGDLANSEVEALGIGHLAIVEAKRLFIAVGLQVKRLDAHVRALQRSLEQAPEVLKTIRVDRAANVFFRVVDELVSIAVNIDVLVGLQSVAIDRRSLLDILVDVGTDIELASKGEHLHAGLLCVAFQKSTHDGFADRAATQAAIRLQFRLLALVHVFYLATDESFIGLDFARQLSGLLTLLRKPDPVKHEPSRLLSDTQCASDFTTANPVLTVQNHPRCGKPFFQTNRGVFHDRADLDGKLSLRVPITALPPRLILEETNIGTPAGRANYAVFPLGATGDQIVKTVRRISEVKYRFLKSLRFVSGFHTLILPRIAGLVNDIIAVRFLFLVILPCRRHVGQRVEGPLIVMVEVGLVD
jgi:hypothetical protein